MKGFLRFVVFMFVVYSLLSGLIGLLGRDQVDEVLCSDRYEQLGELNDRTHQRQWESLDAQSSFCTNYESFDETSINAGNRRALIMIDAFSYEDLWGTVYGNLISDSKRDIFFLVDSLREIAVERNLSRRALAEMVVTFVQDIPYSYVLSIDCDDYETGDKPCIGNVALGLLSPYEFLHTLYGDCDTRTVLIYAILEEFGFDPMIVVSDEYAHAMLALHVPAAGDHLKHRGRNYYFWETTAKGWPIGMLPPSTSNINYWKVALVNNES